MVLWHSQVNNKDTMRMINGFMEQNWKKTFGYFSIEFPTSITVFFTDSHKPEKLCSKVTFY